MKISEPDDAVIEHLRASLANLQPAHNAPTDAELTRARRQRRLVITTAVVAAAAVPVVWFGIQLPIGEGSSRAHDGSGRATSNSTNSQTTPPPCSAIEAPGLIMVEDIQKYPSAQAAVLVRSDDIEITGVRDDPDDDALKLVSVTDDWGRTGEYTVDQYRGGWFVTNMDGCAAY